MFTALAGGFLKGFAAGRTRKEQRDLAQQEIKAKTKLYEIQIQREQQALLKDQQQNAAQGELLDTVAGSSALKASPNTRLLNPEGPKSLTDMLADPQSTLMLLQSGLLKGDDILKQQSDAKNLSLLERLLGGPGVIDETGATGGGPQGSFEVSGVKLDASGRPMLDLSRRGEVQRWMPSADGMFQVGYDRMGRPVTSVPASPADRAKEDQPLTATELASFVDENGNSPPPGTTLRQAQAGGFKASPGDKVAPDVAGRISGLVQGKQIYTALANDLILQDGSINRPLVLTAFAKVPGTKGRSIRNDIGIAVDAVLRARTGAGVNKEEMAQVIDQFMPSPLDSDEGIKLKLSRFQQFVDGTLDVATLPPRVRKALEASAAPSAGTGASKVIDFNTLPP